MIFFAYMAICNQTNSAIYSIVDFSTQKLFCFAKYEKPHLVELKRQITPAMAWMLAAAILAKLEWTLVANRYQKLVMRDSRKYVHRCKKNNEDEVDEKYFLLIHF